MGQNGQVELHLHFHRETDAAIMVSEDGDPKVVIWLPKSRITYTKDASGGVYVTMPEWLAKNEGLV